MLHDLLPDILTMFFGEVLRLAVADGAAGGDRAWRAG